MADEKRPDFARGRDIELNDGEPALELERPIAAPAASLGARDAPQSDRLTTPAATSSPAAAPPLLAANRVGAWCAAHPLEKVKWTCSGCGLAQCGECAKWIAVGINRFAYCTKCNRALAQTSHGARPRHSFAELFRRLATAEAIINAVAVALVGYLLGLAFPRLSYGVYAGYFFLVVSHVGRGRDGLPNPADGSEQAGDLVRYAWRGFACAVAPLVPAGLYWLAATSFDLSPLPVIPLLIAGGLCLPAAVVASVLSDGVLAALWIPLWGQIIVRAPAAYAGLVASLLAFALLAGSFTGSFVRFGIPTVPNLIAMVPFVGGVLSAATGAFVLSAYAVLIGAFLNRHAGELGFED